MSDLTLALPDELLEQLAERVAALLAAQAPPAPEAWLDVDGAARHLGYADNPQRGRRRIYDLTSARETNAFPVHRDGSRLLFKATELDAWLTTQESQ